MFLLDRALLVSNYKGIPMRQSMPFLDFVCNYYDGSKFHWGRGLNFHMVNILVINMYIVLGCGWGLVLAFSTFHVSRMPLGVMFSNIE